MLQPFAPAYKPLPILNARFPSFVYYPGAHGLQESCSFRGGAWVHRKRRRGAERFLFVLAGCLAHAAKI